MRKFSLQDDRETLKVLKLRESRTAYKNVVGICTSFILCFGSYLGIIGLQTSINSDGGLGLWTVGVLYTTYILTGVVGPAMVRLVGSKYTLIVGYTLFMAYATLNYYPDWGTLMTGSLLLGLMGNTAAWTALFTHATVTAIRYAPALKEEPKHAISLFIGMVGLALKLSRVFGSSISAIVLWNLPSAYNTSDNSSSTEDAVCDNDSASQVEQNYIYYILITIYVLCCAISIVIVIATVDHFAVETKFMSYGNMVKLYLVQPMVDAIKLSVKWKFLLLAPLSFTNGLLIGLSLSVYTKLYVSDCYGVQWVGTMLVVYGMVGGIAAISAGRLVKYVPQCVMLYVALGVSSGLSLFLAMWDIVPSYYVMVGAVVGLALSEGTINALIPGIYGYLFQDQKEVALGLFQQWVGAGIAASFFGFEILRETVEVELIHVYVWSLTVGVLVLTIATYTMLTVLNQCRRYSGDVAAHRGTWEPTEFRGTWQSTELIGTWQPNGQEHPAERCTGVASEGWGRPRETSV